MIVHEDIKPLEELGPCACRVVNTLHDRRRPILLTVAGEPDTLMVPVELLDSKRTALRAACELLDSQDPGEWPRES